MDPLGGDTGIFAAFGVTVAVALVAAIRLRERRYAVARTTLVGLLCGVGVYALIAAVMYVVAGTGGYSSSTWLVLIVAGLIPAGVIGLLEGLVASLVVRVFAGR